MSARLIAQRYAKALLDLSEKDRQTDAVRTELRELAALVQAQPDFTRFIHARLIGPSRKALVIREILTQAGASNLVQRFFQVVAEAARLDLFLDIVAAYDRLVDAHRGVVEADVRTATPLTPNQESQLTMMLAGRTGKTIRLKVQRDPSLLGGLTVQVGSTVYDASLVGQLKQLKAKLLSA